MVVKEVIYTNSQLIRSFAQTTSIEAYGALPHTKGRQNTIKSSVGCDGIGVHSNAPAHLVIHPAPIGTGIVFVRNDQPDAINRIPARFNTVVSTQMSTTLANEHGVTASTVEHILAALAGAEISNAIIEIDGPEVPIMDGSSLMFSKMIESVGIAKQKTSIPTIIILEPIQVTHGNGVAEFIPYNGRKISFLFDENSPFYSLTDQRECHFDFDIDVFSELLADARTFGFFEDAQKLWNIGLAKGSSLENTVVFKQNEILNEEGLRSHDEMVRHKVLDAIGDLALAGVQIRGHFRGINSGHGLNNKLLHALFSTPESWRFVD